MAHRISTKQAGILNHLDQIAMNQSNYGNVYGGTVGGFGIVKGCQITSQGTGNMLRIAKGRIMISGALVEIEQTDINLGTNTTTDAYSLIAKINLKEDTISVRAQKNPYTATMVDLYEQPDADSELLLGTFTFDKGVIKNIITGMTFKSYYGNEGAVNTYNIGSNYGPSTYTGLVLQNGTISTPLVRTDNNGNITVDKSVLSFSVHAIVMISHLNSVPGAIKLDGGYSLMATGNIGGTSISKTFVNLLNSDRTVKIEIATGCTSLTTAQPASQVQVVIHKMK